MLKTPKVFLHHESREVSVCWDKEPTSYAETAHSRGEDRGDIGGSKAHRGGDTEKIRKRIRERKAQTKERLSRACS